MYSGSRTCSNALKYKHGEEQICMPPHTHTHKQTHTHIMLSPAEESSLYLIEVEAIFLQVAVGLFRAGLIRVKGICLLLLDILKYNSIYTVFYMLMQRLPLHRLLTQVMCAYL